MHRSGTLWCSRSDLFRKITPARIRSLDQPELPNTVPFLELAFALERALAGFVLLEPNQHLDTVLSREAGHGADLMLPNAASEIVGHADVERAIAEARQNVDVEAHEFFARVAGFAPLLISHLQTPAQAEIRPF